MSDSLDETRLRAPTPVPGAIGPGTRLLNGKFELRERLGGGGMGIVYQAADLDAERLGDPDARIAIKVLSESIQAIPEATLALQRESSRARRLAHPNIVRVYEFYQDGNVRFLTMELLQGESWDQLFREYATGMPLHEARDLIQQLCSGLEYAHSQGMVHSDLKPGNVFITKDGTVKILDFGIAAQLRQARPSDHETLYDPRRLGALSPSHACLEQWLGLDADVRDDVYGLACIVYQLLSGEHPFRGLTASEAFERGLSPRPLPVLNQDQNRALLHALRLRRSERTVSVAAFRAHLLQPSQVSPIRHWRIGILVAGSLVVASGGYLFDRQLFPPTRRRPASPMATGRSRPSPITPASLSTAQVGTPMGANAGDSAAHSGAVRLTVVRSPETARILFDGVEASGESVTLSPGMHQLAALAPGYYGLIDSVHIEPDRTTPLTVNLQPVDEPSGSDFAKFLAVNAQLSRRDTSRPVSEGDGLTETTRVELQQDVDSVSDPTLRAILSSRLMRLEGQPQAADALEQRMSELAQLGDARAAAAVTLIAATTRGRFTQDMATPELKQASEAGDPLATFLLALVFRTELTSAMGKVTATSPTYHRYCADLAKAVQQGWSGLPSQYRSDCPNVPSG